MGPVPQMPEAESPNVSLTSAGGGAEPRYKIGDVCRIADVQPYVLRYWESEFPSLAPDRSAQGPRTYSVRELRIIERVKKLLYDEGYTIAGAKKKLESELGGKGSDAVPAPLPEPPRAKEAKDAKGKAPKAAADTVPTRLAETAPVPAATAPIAIPATASPAKPAPDPRIGKTVAELKEILRLLSRR